MTTEEDFQRGLDLDPSNHQLRLVFADWLDEQGDPRGPGYRALGVNRRWPEMTKPNPDGSREWFFGTDLRPPRSGQFVRQVLPDDWYLLIVAKAESQLLWKFLDTRREAEDTAAIAFAKLPLERQRELLNGTGGANRTDRRGVE